MHKIRTFGEHYDPGGGGINVARVVHEWGGDTLAVFAAGGVTGRFVKERRRLRRPCSHKLHFDTWPHAHQPDRPRAGKRGGIPLCAARPAARCGGCMSILDALGALEADRLVASGSLPPGVPPEFYASVAQLAVHRGIKFALDTSGAALKAPLGHGVDLLKPSLGEFETIAGRANSDRSSRARQAVDLVRSGAARMIALTLGATGRFSPRQMAPCNCPPWR